MIFSNYFLPHLLNVTNSLGKIIHYNHIKLKNYVVLDPEWITESLYILLNAEQIIKKNGFLFHQKLNELWHKDKYPEKLHPFLMELLEKFEFAYPIRNMDVYDSETRLVYKDCHLIPALLPDIPPDYIWNYENNLKFVYRYEFLPKNIFTRLIVRLHHIIHIDNKKNELCWGDGVIFAKENGMVFVELNRIKKTITLLIDGKNKIELLSILRNEIDEINKSIKYTEIRKEIPCTCKKGCGYVFEYEKLLDAEEKGVPKIQCQESWGFIDLKDILNGVSKKRERKNELLATKQRNRDERFKGITYPNLIQEITMGDKYEAGQVGAQGPNAHAHDMTFNQLWNQTKKDIDLHILSKELNSLRDELQKSAKKPEDYAEIGAVATAEIEAQNGNGLKALSSLSKVGKWTLSVAEKIGIGVATSAIKSACGL